MAASYPTSAKSFSTKATNDAVEASHVNDLQEEVTALETALLTGGLAHNVIPSGTRSLGSAAAPWAGLIAQMLTSKAGATYTNADTTPSVLNTTFMSITNSGATTITNFDDGVEGQLLILTFEDSNTTINRSNAFLSGGANFTGSVADIIALIKVGAAWREVCRSVNA